MIRFAVRIIVIIIVLVCGLGSLTAAEMRPNFIVFIADDMAWNDCGVCGHDKIRTPNIDELARGGMQFHNAFLTISSCSPSRCSLITGRYPHNTGAGQLHLPLPGDQVTFVEKLKSAGYYTAAAGKWHLGEATKPKFDKVVTRMNQWVATLQARPEEKPFFMWFAFSDPHRPYQKNTIDKPHTPDDTIVPPFLPDNPDTRADLAAYYDEITRLDSVMGKVSAELEKQGATENTMVLFMSDNGRPFPRCKTTVLDSGIQTPWIVRWPRVVKAGSECASLISSIDLAPTVLELAGVAIPKTVQGISFKPLLTDPNAKTRDAIFAEHNWHDFDDHQRAVRTMQFKYIRNSYTDIPLTPPADAVRSPTYQKMHKLKEAGKLTPAQLSTYQTPRPSEELYDLNKDPYEMKNIASDPAYTKPLAKMRKRLDDWIERTDDVVPAQRRPDEFHRVTGDRLPAFQKPKRKS